MLPSQILELNMGKYACHFATKEETIMKLRKSMPLQLYSVKLISPLYAPLRFTIVITS